MLTLNRLGPCVQIGIPNEPLGRSDISLECNRIYLGPRAMIRVIVGIEIAIFKILDVAKAGGPVLVSPSLPFYRQRGFHHQLVPV
jgi:hypothetical protein